MSQIELSEKELEYYSRQIVLAEMGYNAQLQLKDAKVCLLGLGGLGSPTAMQLAAIGIGHLRLVDRDVVELSNLQRQHLYSVDDVGYPKVEVAVKRLQSLNPYIEIEPVPLSINEDNAEDIVKGRDVVIDGLDRMTPRYAVNRACVKLGIPYVFGAAITTIGNVSTIVPSETPCLECFYGNLVDDNLPKCAVVGVHPSLLSIIASVEVSEAIRILVGKQPRLANKLLYCDIENVEFNEVHVSKAEKCPVCGSKPSGSPMPLKREFVEEACGRSGKRVFVIVPKKNLEINLADLHGYLRKKGFNIKVKANLGITFEHDHKVTTSILKSGIMIIEGTKEKEEAVKLFDDLIIARFNIPKSLTR
ncbi:MAG: HesA/MoeB/ThiF family protein [Candidatus Bathyarchaeota archaeon]|nr:MAG: HesA/MoeB/ThiF family protein [Candidatus Bathyarchaeota archaeon]